jgi:hypothetical protein
MYGGDLIAGLDTKPVAFISSFREEENVRLTNAARSLYELRRRLNDLNTDKEFKNSLPLTGKDRRLTWVAERPAQGEEDISKWPDKMAIADRLVTLVRESDVYVCILADRRRTYNDHGALISFGEDETEVSYFGVLAKICG